MSDPSPTRTEPIFLSSPIKSHDLEAVNDFLNNYFDAERYAQASVSRRAMYDVIGAILRCIKFKKTIYVCGNGGSAALADHFVCDVMKGTREGRANPVKIVSLASNGPMLTALANDISYRDVFWYQLRALASHGDMLIAISTSGNSDNIVKAIEYAADHGIEAVAMVGMDGGKMVRNPVYSHLLHVESDNVGIIEDVHCSLMHVLAQYLVRYESGDIRPA